jgi:hypothetical protein
VDDLDDRDLARLLGLTRIAFGVAGFLMPNTTMRAWIGQRAQPYPTNMLLRGLAGRDIAIGVGIVTALETGAPVRGWLEASALSDAADAVGTLTSWRSLPGFRRITALALEVGAAALGLQLADSLGEE